MERNEIEAFLTLSEELHFGRTADRLRVSTAHVSKTIKGLERQVGVALFERTSRKVVLTPVGRRLCEELRPAYEQVRRSVRNAELAGRGLHGTLRVGYFGSAGGRYLPQLPAYFDEFHHPDQTPSGRPIEPGPTAATFPEILALVGAGKGVYLTTEQAPLFYRRPDVTFIPVTDAPPLQFGLGWLNTGLTARVQAFVQTASDTTARQRT
ncbi:LysR family transcriptional regulator [Streptomyces anulatus]|uniref:LysR family transcriptional regulator n=1 Tax=Streptomyces anulatus TaxID=1892 RepID=UPI0036C45471